MPDPSFAAALQRHAAERPTDLALSLLAADGLTTRNLTYAELDQAARVAAEHIGAARSGDEPVLLLTRTDPSCVAALCGCLYGRIPFAPVPIPGRGSEPHRLKAFAAASGASVFLAPSDTLHLQSALPDRTWLAIDAFPTSPAEPRNEFGGDVALAMVQFTSGSTAEPKGVALSAANIVANLEMLRTAFRVDAYSRYASWLPLFHDMGLAMLLMPLYFGVPGVLLPPMSFLRRPARWLQAIDRFNATITGAPNFAYDLCTSRITADEVAGLDLGRCRIAFCGAEPVRRATMTAFAERFASSGFDSGALYPCYGLAEAVTFVAGGFMPVTADATQGVSCGRAAAGSIIVIVDPDTSTPCADGTAGEIWVAGPHVASGYLNRPHESKAQFAASLPAFPHTAFLRTGDLGALVDGQLTVTGRIKDIIIYRGENIHAVDVEDTVSACHVGGSGIVVAFGCTVGDRECLVVVQEAVRGHAADPRALGLAAEDAVALAFGVRLYDFVLVRRGSLPKTTSGKVKRDAVRQLYTAGLIDRTPAQDMTISIADFSKQ